MVNLAREPVRRKPFDHRVRVEKCPIHLLGRRTQYAMKPDGVCRHHLLLSLGRSSRSPKKIRRGPPPPNDPAAQRPPNGKVARMDPDRSTRARPRAAEVASGAACASQLRNSVDESPTAYHHQSRS